MNEKHQYFQKRANLGVSTNRAEERGLKALQIIVHLIRLKHRETPERGLCEAMTNKLAKQDLRGSLALHEALLLKSGGLLLKLQEL